MKKVFIYLSLFFLLASCSKKEIPTYLDKPSVSISDNITVTLTSLQQKLIYNDYTSTSDSSLIIDLLYENNTKEDIIIGYSYTDVYIDDNLIQRSFNYSEYVQGLELYYEQNSIPKNERETVNLELEQVEILKSNSKKNSLLLYAYPNPATSSILRLEFFDIEDHLLAKMYVDISNVRFEE